jgi:hypothetical protein
MSDWSPRWPATATRSPCCATATVPSPAAWPPRTCPSPTSRCSAARHGRLLGRLPPHPGPGLGWPLSRIFQTLAVFLAATVHTRLFLVVSPLWFLGVYAGLTALTLTALTALWLTFRWAERG